MPPEGALPGSAMLSSARIALRRGEDGEVVLRVGDGEERRDVRVINPLPLGEDLRFVCFADRKGKEIAMVRVDGALAPAARAIIEEELSARYLRGVIRSIHAIDMRHRILYLDVETDRGRRQFVVPSPTENVRRVSADHLVITDACENRFEIPSVRELDPRSRRLLDQLA